VHWGAVLLSAAKKMNYSVALVECWVVLVLQAMFYHLKRLYKHKG
jgi:hypothetical protein